MKERARAYLLSIGYDEASVEETIANATEEELRELVSAEAPKPKPKPKPRRNPNPSDVKLKLGTNMVDIPINKPKTVSEFDPVEAAMACIKKEEAKPPIKYVVTQCYKLTICSDIDSETFNAVKAELKARGGKWSPELEGFLFDTNPDELL